MLASILVLEKAGCKPLASTDGCRIRPSCCQRWVPGLGFRMAVRGSLGLTARRPAQLTVHLPTLTIGYVTSVSRYAILVLGSDGSFGAGKENKVTWAPTSLGPMGRDQGPDGFSKPTH